MEEEFGVQASALRDDAVAAAEAAQAQASTFIDPAEAAKFSRDFPQILMQGAFAAPMLETQAPAAAEAAGEAGLNYLWQGDSIRPGGESGKAVGAAAELAAPGDDNRDDTLPAIQEESDSEAAEESGEAEETTTTVETDEDDPTAERNAAGEPMSEEEQAQVQELRNRDREVRVHEQAHQAAGGQYAGGASYTYQQGPDGNRYAIGGEVSIDTSAERTPEETVSKMQQVRSAALAPAEPSSQDRAVAASAQAAEMEARGQIAEQRAAETSGADGEDRESGEESTDETSAAEPSATATEAAGSEAATTTTTATASSADAENTRTAATTGIPEATGPTAPGTTTRMDVPARGLSRFTNHIDDAYRNQYMGVESLINARQASTTRQDPLMASAMAYRPIDIVA